MTTTRTLTDETITLRIASAFMSYDVYYFTCDHCAYESADHANENVVREWIKLHVESARHCDM